MLLVYFRSGQERFYKRGYVYHIDISIFLLRTPSLTTLVLNSTDIGTGALNRKCEIYELAPRVPDGVYCTRTCIRILHKRKSVFNNVQYKEKVVRLEVFHFKRNIIIWPSTNIIKGSVLMTYMVYIHENACKGYSIYYR